MLCLVEQKWSEFKSVIQAGKCAKLEHKFYIVGSSYALLSFHLCFNAGECARQQVMCSVAALKLNIVSMNKQEN